MKVTIDRFEDGYAVLLVRGDECTRIDFPDAYLPDGCREGDILDICIYRDEAGTEEARKRVSDLIGKLKRKHPDNKPEG